MEGYNYDAVASTIKLEDITSNRVNQGLLRRVKENDPDFDKMLVTDNCEDGHCVHCMDYCPDGARDLGWMGYYIGENMTLKHLRFPSNSMSIRDLEPFFRGVNQNRYIQSLSFYKMNLFGGEIFQSLRPLFENNNSLCEISVEECAFSFRSARELSLALRCCNKSLKSLYLECKA